MARKADLSLQVIRIMERNLAVTRPRLVKETASRAATVLEVVDELKKKHLLLEPDRMGKRTGRRSPVLTLNPDCFWCVGIDFQLRKTIGVITDMTGKILFRAEIPAIERTSLHGCRNEIREVIRRLHAQADSNWKKVSGIGFADPGLVDTNQGISIRAVNLPGWENTRTGDWLKSENQLPSLIRPECMVKTYMEALSRQDRCTGSLFHIGLDDGIGGGFVRNGDCFIGDTFQGMEIGHIVVAPSGPLCQCGNRGCLEAVAGEAGIRRKIREILNSGVDTSLRLDHFSISSFAECVPSDKAARMIAGEICDSIGHALAVVVTLLNPSCIVLSGELTKLGDLLLNSIRSVLNMSCFSGSVQNLKLEFSELSPDDTARGAALLIRNKLLEEI